MAQPDDQGESDFEAVVAAFLKVDPEGIIGKNADGKRRTGKQEDDAETPESGDPS